MANCRRLPIVALVLGVFACGCAEKSTPPRPLELSFLQSDCRQGSETTPGESSQSTCLDHSLGAGAGLFSSVEIVRFAAGHDTILVYHDSASFNCCSLIRFDVEAHDTVLEFFEVDTAHGLCDCMCHFDLASFVSGLSRGMYTARLWTEGRTKLLGEAVVFVPGAEGLLRLGRVDSVRFETQCDTLTVHHDGVDANCCSKFIFAFTQQGNLLAFTEIDTSSVPCRCTCNFDLTAQVSGLTGGQYRVQVWAADSLLDSGAVQITPCLGR